jgi:hypothetical protein
MLWPCRPGVDRCRLTLAVGAPVALAGVVALWFAHRTDANPRPFFNPLKYPLEWAIFVEVNAPAAVHFVGLAVIPLVALWPVWPVGKRSLRLLSLVVATLLAWLAVSFGVAHFRSGDYSKHLFPYLPNTLSAGGALTVSEFAGGDFPVVIGPSARLLLTLAGCVGLAALLARADVGTRFGATGRLLAAFSLLHGGVMLLICPLFDRYLIALLPGVFLFALPRRSSGRPRWGLGTALVVASGLWSFALVRDCLAWNAARWELGRRAVARGVPATDIEGGFEWNGWSVAGVPPGRKDNEPWKGWEPFRPVAGPPPGLVLARWRQAFPAVTGRFGIAFSEVPGSVAVDSEPYRLWLAPGPRRLLLLEHGAVRWPRRETK